MGEKKTYILFGLVCLLQLVFFSCKKDDCVSSKGEKITKRVELPPFKKVALNLSANLYLEPDPNIQSPELTFISQGNIIERISSNVVNDKLVLCFNQCVDRHKEILMYLKYPNTIDTIFVSSSGNYFTGATLKQKNLVLVVDNQGTTEITVSVDKLTTITNGRGNVTYKGGAKTHVINHMGTGLIDGRQLGNDTLIARISNSGHALVNVNDSLHIELAGKGNLYLVEPITSADTLRIDSGRVFLYNPAIHPF